MFVCMRLCPRLCQYIGIIFTFFPSCYIVNQRDSFDSIVITTPKKQIYFVMNGLILVFKIFGRLSSTKGHYY